MARLGRLNVMLEYEVKDKFHEIAVSFGLTDSALGAYLVGQYVHAQSQQKPMQEALQKVVSEAVEGQMKAMFQLMADESTLGEGDPAHVEQGGTSPQ